MLGLGTIRDTSRVTFFVAALALGITLTLVAERLGIAAAILGSLLLPLLSFFGPAACRQTWGFVGDLRKHLAWWHWLWLLLFLSYLNFRPRSAQDIQGTPVDTWALYRIVLVALVACVLGARLAVRKGEWLGPLFRGLPGLLSAYVLVSLVSTLWSVYPAWTLYRSLEYWVDVALLAAIVAAVKSAETYRTLFDWTLTLYVLLVSSAWWGVLAWPKLALTPVPGLVGVELTGVFPAVASNGVGELAAVLAIMALARLLTASGRPAPRALHLLLLLASLATLFLSQARSAIVGLLAGVALLMVFGRRLALAAMALAASLPLLAWGASEWLHQYFLRGQSAEMFSSLSGRVDWWDAGWQEFIKAPLTGLGAYTARFAVLAKTGETDVSTIHNSYLEVLLGTSFWGLIPVVAVLAATWWILVQALRKCPRDSEERLVALEAAGVLAVVSVRSVFTSHLVSHPSLSFLLVVGYAELLRRQRNRERRPVHHGGVDATQSLPLEQSAVIP